MHYPAVASDPVLQCVSNLIGPSPVTSAKIAFAPLVPIIILSAMSFCSISSVDCKNLKIQTKNKNGNRTSKTINIHKNVTQPDTQYIEQKLKIKQTKKIGKRKLLLLHLINANLIIFR